MCMYIYMICMCVYIYMLHEYSIYIYYINIMYTCALIYICVCPIEIWTSRPAIWPASKCRTWPDPTAPPGGRGWAYSMGKPIFWFFLFLGSYTWYTTLTYTKLYKVEIILMWLKRCYFYHPWLGMVTIAPIKMVMTWGWFIIVLPTLPIF